MKKYEKQLLQKNSFIKLDKELFDGYLAEFEDGIFISHISAVHKGRGDFSKLLKQLKEQYKWIKIPTPSRQMVEIVSKKGFVHREEFFPAPFSCVGDIMYWKKEE